MRERVIGMLEGMLDDGNQEAIESTFMSPVRIPDASPLSQHRFAARVDCESYMSGLCVLGIMIDGKPIVARCDDIGVIQGFK